MTDDAVEGRAWARNAIAELTASVNECASVIEKTDDRSSLSYVGNALASVARAQEYLLRAKIGLERATGKI